MPAAIQPLDSQLQIRIAQWGVSLQTDPALWTLTDDPEYPGQKIAVASLALPNDRILSMSRYGVDGSRPFDPAEKAGLADGAPLMYACVQDRTPTGPVFLQEGAPGDAQIAEAFLETDATPSQVVLAAIQKWGGELQAGPGLLTASIRAAEAAAAASQPAPVPAAPAMAPELEARVREWAARLETTPSMWTLIDDTASPGEKIAMAAFPLPGTRLLNISRYGIDGSQPFNPAQAAEISNYDGQLSPLMYATIQDELPGGTQFLQEDGPDGEQMAEASPLTPATPSQVVDAAIAKWGIALQQGPGAPDLTAQAAVAVAAEPIAQSAAPAPALTPVATPAPAPAAAVSAPLQDLDGYADIASFANDAYDTDADEIAAANAAASAMAIQAHAPQPIPPHNPQPPFPPINGLDGVDEPAPQPEITPISPETPDEFPNAPRPEINPDSDPIIVPPAAPSPTPEIPVVPPTMMNPVSVVFATEEPKAASDSVSQIEQFLPALNNATQPAATQEEAVLAPVVAEMAPVVETPAAPAQTQQAAVEDWTPATLPQTQASREETIAAAAQGKAVEAPKAPNSRNVLLLTGAIAGLSLAAPAVVATLGVAAAAYVANNLRTQSKAAEEAPFLTRFGKAIGLAVGMVARAAREESGHVRLVALAKAREAQDFARGEAERAAGALRQTGREIKMGVDLAIDPLREAGKEFGRGVEITIDPIRSAAKAAQTGARRARISLSFLAAEGLDSIARAQERVANGVDAAGEKHRALKTRATLAILSARAQFHDAQVALRAGLASVGHAIDRALDQSMNPAAGDSRGAVYSALYGPAVGVNLPTGGLTAFGADIAADRFDARQQRAAAKAQAERQEPQFKEGAQPAAAGQTPAASAAEASPTAPAAAPISASAATPVAESAPAAQMAQALDNFKAISESHDIQSAANRIAGAAASGEDIGEDQFNILKESCARGVLPATFPILPTLNALQATPFAQASAVILGRSAQTLAFAKSIDATSPIADKIAQATNAFADAERLLAANVTASGVCVSMNSPALTGAVAMLFNKVEIAGGIDFFSTEEEKKFTKIIERFVDAGLDPDAKVYGSQLARHAAQAGWAGAIDLLVGKGAAVFMDADMKPLATWTENLPSAQRAAVDAALDRASFSLPDPMAIVERARNERLAKANVASAQTPGRSGSPSAM